MADDLDVLTISEARLAVGVSESDTKYDVQLVAIVTAVSRALDGRYGAVVQREIEDEEAVGGGEVVSLRHWPVFEITEVTEYANTTPATVTLQTPGTQPDAGFYADKWITNSAPFSGRLYRRSGGGCATWGKPVVVSYIAGRYIDTASVDEKFKDAARVMLKNRWRSDQPSAGSFDEFEVPHANFPTFAHPRYTIEALNDELPPPGMA